MSTSSTADAKITSHDDVHTKLLLVQRGMSAGNLTQRHQSCIECTQVSGARLQDNRNERMMLIEDCAASQYLRSSNERTIWVRFSSGENGFQWFEAESNSCVDER